MISPSGLLIQCDPASSLGSSAHRFPCLCSVPLDRCRWPLAVPGACTLRRARRSASKSVSSSFEEVPEVALLGRTRRRNAQVGRRRDNGRRCKITEMGDSAAPRPGLGQQSARRRRSTTTGSGAPLTRSSQRTGPPCSRGSSPRRSSRSISLDELHNDATMLAMRGEHSLRAATRPAHHGFASATPRSVRTSPRSCT